MPDYFSPDIPAVFPTEVTARFWRDWSARHGSRRAVRADRFVSWDTFLEGIFALPEGTRRADALIRHAAVRLLLDQVSRGDSSLTHLIPPEHHKDPGRFYRLVYALLPNLRKLAERTVSTPLAHDISWLYFRYCEILENARCSELSFAQYDVKLPAEQNKVPGVLYFPELITGSGDLMELICSAGIACPAAPDFFTGLAASGAGTYLQYENSSMELQALVDWIEGLLTSGVHPSDVVITLGDYESWQERLSDECSLRGIPLVFRQGKTLASHPAGRFFQDLQGAVSGGWTLEQVKRLLLNRAYPWKDGESLKQIVHAGISKRCISNVPGEDLWTRVLQAGDRKDLLHTWLRFSSHVAGMTGEQKPEKLRESLFGFLDIWMDRESRGEDDFSRVFDYCLQRITDYLEACEYMGLDSCTDLYSQCLRVLADSRYIPQDSDEAVQVFPYGLSGGLYPKYHALAGISQENTQITNPDLPFFSDAALSRFGLGTEDRSDAFLQYCGGEEVRFSGSLDTFSGYSTPPSRFTANASVVPCRYDTLANPLFGERRWWALDPGARHWDGSWYAQQGEGLSYAEKTLFAPSGIDLSKTPVGEDSWYESLLERTVCRRIPGYVRISPYSLDEFTRCPFDWVFSQMLSLEELDSDPWFTDPRDEGILLHECINEFFHEAVGIGSIFNASKMSEYRDQMKSSVRKVLYRRNGTSVWLIHAVLRQLELRFTDMLMQYLDREAALLDQWSSTGLEVLLERKDEDARWSASGRADRIVQQDELGAYGVIDYKRGMPPGGKYDTSDAPPSWQLPFYGWLIEGSMPPEAEARYFLYYSFTQVKFYPVLDGGGEFSRSRSCIKDVQKFLELQQRCGEAVKKMAQKVREGDFTDSRICDGCRDRLLCRRKYHVR